MPNLQRAVAVLPHVLVFDNDNLAPPSRPIAEFEAGVASCWSEGFAGSLSVLASGSSRRRGFNAGGERLHNCRIQLVASSRDQGSDHLVCG